MSLWDVSTLLISSLQQSRYSSFYLDFRVQLLTSGTWELSSKPNNALHRHWLSWASSSAQSQMIPGFFHAQSFARTLVTGSGDFYVAASVPWTSSWKQSPALVLLPHCRLCSEIVLPIPIGLQVTSFSSHFLHVIPETSHHAAAAALVVFCRNTVGLPCWDWFWCTGCQDKGWKNWVSPIDRAWSKQSRSSCCNRLHLGQSREEWEV